MDQVQKVPLQDDESQGGRVASWALPFSFSYLVKLKAIFKKVKRKLSPNKRIFQLELGSFLGEYQYFLCSRGSAGIYPGADSPFVPEDCEPVWFEVYKILHCCGEKSQGKPQTNEVILLQMFQREVLRAFLSAVP